MIAILLTIIISQSQYWEQAVVGLAPACINEVIVASARNDGVKRVYGACENGRIYEYEYIQTGWIQTVLPPVPGDPPVYSIDCGPGKNDQIMRIYGAFANGQIYEFTYNNASNQWEITDHLLLLPNPYSWEHLVMASGIKPDGLFRVYAGDCYKKQTEFTYQNGVWVAENIADVGRTSDLIAAQGKNDGKMRLYLTNSDTWQISYESGNWVTEKVNEVQILSDYYDIAAGVGRNDDSIRLYVTEYQTGDDDPGYPRLTEFTWNGIKWACRYLMTGSSGHQPHGVDVGVPRKDGNNRLYLAAYYYDGSVYHGRMVEFDLVPGNSFNIGDYLGTRYRDLVIGEGRNDQVTRVYISAEDGGIIEYSYLPKLPSNSQHATAFNEQPHLVRVPNSEELYVVYQSSIKIFFSHSPDGGINWDLPQIIGNGIYPAISLKTGGEIYTPCVTFLSPDGEDLIYRYRQPSPPFDWQGFTIFDGNPALRPEQASLFITNQDGYDSVRVAFRVMDLMAEHSYIYYADFPWYEIGSASHIYPIDPYQLPPDYIDRRSPSISADMFNQLHVAWQRADEMTGLGETYYRYRDVSGIWSQIYNVWPSPDIPSVYPHCEGYGDSIFVHWSEELSSQNLDVKRASRWIFDPLDRWKRFEPYPTPDSSVFPVCASGEFSVWSEKVNNSNFEIYYWNRSTNQVGNLSETPNRSWFGHSIYYQSIVGLPTLYTCWTESLYADAYEVKFKATGGFDWSTDRYVCFYSIPVGDSALTRYTMRRSGRVYCANRKIWTDYDSTALIYKLICPNPKFLYKVIAVPYHEKTGQWSTKFTADNMSVRTISFNSGIWDTFQFWLPETTYKYDRLVNLRIEKVTGEYVPVAYLRVYQFEKKKTSKEGGYAQGGTQSTETREISLRTQLNQISPNPANKNINIAYSLSKNARVTLKIFDISGRLIKTLINLHQTSGFHNMLWDGKDNRGLTVKNGVYFIEMKTNDYKATKKLIILK